MNQNVHQFHFGPRQRNFARRDIFQEIFNQQQHHHQERQENTIIGRIIPYLFLLFMLYNALIPTTDTSSSYSLQKSYRHPIERKTKSRSVLYHVSNSFDRKYQGYQVKRVEEIVEHEFMLGLQNGCYREREVQNDMIRRAQGWFSNDLDLLKKAQDMKMEKCVELREFLKK